MSRPACEIEPSRLELRKIASMGAQRYERFFLLPRFSNGSRS